MSRLFFVLLGEIRRLRKQKKVSQVEAGRLIGCNQSQYGKKERGKQQFSLAEYCLLVENLASEGYGGGSSPGEVGGGKPWFVEFFGYRILDALGTESKQGEEIFGNDTGSGTHSLHDAGGLKN